MTLSSNMSLCGRRVSLSLQRDTIVMTRGLDVSARNIFVVGLNDDNHERLLRLKGAEEWRFHR
ncbi:hypothetical protein R0K18_29890, partial [Pantoea sp. SIMBA_133]